MAVYSWGSSQLGHSCRWAAAAAAAAAARARARVRVGPASGKMSWGLEGELSLAHMSSNKCCHLEIIVTKPAGPELQVELESLGAAKSLSSFASCPLGSVY